MKFRSVAVAVVLTLSGAMSGCKDVQLDLSKYVQRVVQLEKVLQEDGTLAFQGSLKFERSKREDHETRGNCRQECGSYGTPTCYTRNVCEPTATGGYDCKV